MKRLLLFGFSVLILGLWSCAETAKEVYISQDGNDSNPGTIEQPLASFAGAQSAVRSIKKDNPARDINVFFRGGVYLLKETVVFKLEDSGNPGQKITYAAYPGEKPVISAGVPVKEWQKVTDYPKGLPEAAKGNLWQADVSFLKKIKAQQTPSPTVASQMDRTHLFYTLYNNSQRLQRARGEGFSLVERPGKKVDSENFSFPKGAIKNWPDLANAELHFIPHYYWVSNILPISKVNEKSGTALTSEKCTYLMNPPRKMSYRTTAVIENVVELLDKPGEWVLDNASNRLYYWPEGDSPGDDIVAPVLTELIRVEGETDYEGPVDTPVKNIHFRGLTFTHGDRFPWHGKTGWGLQHDWERFDSPSALVRFRGAENCSVEDCRFTTAGCTGVRFDFYSRENRVVGNQFENLGGVGILLSGYGPGTKDVNRKNEISNNHIHNIGELYWGSPAIFIWQSGENRIAHNNIHDVPYTGICVTGRIRWDRTGRSECSKTVRWEESGGINETRSYEDRASTWYQREKYLHARNNMIERNDISKVTQRCGDGNAIYISGAGTGNIALENYCHDIYGRRLHSIIRLDDDQNGSVIKGNILYRHYKGRGEGITSKGKNDLVGNIIVDLRDGQNSRHRGYMIFPNAPIEGSKIQHNVFYSLKKGQYEYGQGNEETRLYPTHLKAAEVDYNVYYNTEDPQSGVKHLKLEQVNGIEEHSIAADPMFTDIENGDFSFKPGSPALKLGIEQPVSLDDVGLEAKYRK